jgi:hypothetical protein
MTPEERDLIAGLFSRLRSADAPDKDREAEALINSGVQALPSAPYLLVQTLLVHEHALNNAQARIADLERQLAQARQPAPAAQSSGSFLDRAAALGPWNRTPAQSYPAQTAYPAQGPSAGYTQTGAYQQPPYPTTAMMPASAGGGFLRSALTTAAGVAGGALLFEGISGLLGHNAGPFGGGFGGGYGGGFGGGYAPTEEIIENNTTINNYGSDQSGSAGDASYSDASSGDDTNYDQASDSGFDSGGDFGGSDDSGFA